MVTDQVLELSSGLLNHTILATDDNAHATKVTNFGLAYDEGVDVETTPGQNTRHAGEHPWLILNKTV